MDYIIAGWKLVDIAKALKCTPQNIHDIKSSTIFQDTLAQRRAILDDSLSNKLSSQVSDSLSDSESINKTLKEGARAAVEKLCGFVDGSIDCSPSITRQSASDILDRAGYPKLTKMETTGNTIFVLDKEDLQRIEKTIELDLEPLTEN